MSVWVSIAVSGGDTVYVPAKDEAEAKCIVTDVEGAIHKNLPVTISADNGKVTINPRYIITASYGRLNA